jgi:hypothetical protein
LIAGDLARPEPIQDAPNRSSNVELHREEPWTWLSGQPPQ